MSDTTKIRYEIDLATALPGQAREDVTIRSLDPSDRDGLAHLMLDAYLGTIDYEGETLAEAIGEVDSWLEGTPMLDHSFGVVTDGQLVSAVLVSTIDHVPLIGYVMTDAEHKASGLGGAVTRSGLASLKSSGYSHVVLYITKGNTPSERLFAGLGATTPNADKRP